MPRVEIGTFFVVQNPQGFQNNTFSGYKMDPQFLEWQFRRTSLALKDYFSACLLFRGKWNKILKKYLKNFKRGLQVAENIYQFIVFFTSSKINTCTYTNTQCLIINVLTNEQNSVNKLKDSI